MSRQVGRLIAPDANQPSRLEPLAKSSYIEALINHEAPRSRWPREREAQEARLTPVCLPDIRPTFTIQPDDLIFTIGSCFARNIEEHLTGIGFDVAVSRFEKMCQDEGVVIKSNTLNKFVIQSIVNELRWALEPDRKFPSDSIVEVKDGRYLDMQLAPGHLPAALETVQATRRAVSNYMRTIRSARIVIVTLGLAEAWYDSQLELYLNAMPLKASALRCPERFEHHVLEYNQILASLREMLGLLERFGHPDFRMLLTVSPVSFGSTFTEHDALVANSYSKSVQRAAVEVISREHPRVDYLPTFESVTLSEPAFAWREDRAHVSTEIVRLNVLRMEKAYVAPRRSNAPGPVPDAGRVQALKLAKQANHLFRTGELGLADNMFERAVQSAPDELLPHIQWGEALYRQKRWAEAARELQAAMELGGRRYNVAYQLAKSYCKVFLWAEAEGAAKAAIEDMPDDPRPYKLLAKASKHQGRVSEAEIYRKKFDQMTVGLGS
jgi:tetratricopeptide (TPR) repeat protein